MRCLPCWCTDRHRPIGQAEAQHQRDLRRVPVGAVESDHGDQGYAQKIGCLSDAAQTDGTTWRN